MPKIKVVLHAEWEEEVDDSDLAESAANRLDIEDPNWQPSEKELAEELEEHKRVRKVQISEDPFNEVPRDVMIDVTIS